MWWNLKICSWGKSKDLFMGNSASKWGTVGDIASVVQLPGLDACRLIALIIKVASNALILKQRCRDFANYLKFIGDPLEKIMMTDLMESPETKELLKPLEDVLRHSYDLVQSCHKKSYMNLCKPRLSKQLDKAEADIDKYLKVIPLFNLLYIQQIKEMLKEKGVAPFSKWEKELLKIIFDPRFKEKLKERKREMLKRKEREEQEMERVRVKARRKDAVTSYQSLLTERIKDCEASWTESRPKLEKDPLGRATNSDLDLAERERLFREYVNGLYKRCVREYRSLLADVITVDVATKHLEDGKNILTSWSEAKRLLKPDQRYARMPRRERGLWWRRYAEDVQRRVKVTGSERNEDKPNVDDSSRRSPGARKNQSRR